MAVKNDGDLYGGDSPYEDHPDDGPTRPMRDKLRDNEGGARVTGVADHTGRGVFIKPGVAYKPSQHVSEMREGVGRTPIDYDPHRAGANPVVLGYDPHSKESAGVPLVTLGKKPTQQIGTRTQTMPWFSIKAKLRTEGVKDGDTFNVMATAIRQHGEQWSVMPDDVKRVLHSLIQYGDGRAAALLQYADACERAVISKIESQRQRQR